MNWKQARSFFNQDVGALAARAASRLDHRIGVAGRRLLGSAILAASLAGAGTLYAYSKPIEPTYTTEKISYVVTDTIAVPQQHVVEQGESVWGIVAVPGETALQTTARVKELCAMNAQLGAIDNRSVVDGLVRYTADNIPCDYLPVGAVLTLPALRTPVQYLREATLYHQVPQRDYYAAGLFFGVLGMATSVAGLGVAMQRQVLPATASPQLELLLEYTR